MESVELVWYRMRKKKVGNVGQSKDMIEVLEVCKCKSNACMRDCLNDEQLQEMDYFRVNGIASGSDWGMHVNME